jgi:cell division protease FtsH
MNFFSLSFFLSDSLEFFLPSQFSFFQSFLIQDFLNFVFTLVVLVVFCFSLFRLTENILFQFENNIESFFNNFPDGEFEEEEEDFLNDFMGLDDNIVQLIPTSPIKFSDVAGNEEAKVELKEVVKFLKDPESFSRLGASVPKGVLLAGPPGTGKTLLAKAIAGEAGTPFLKVSGSQFVELLVGVGAARVRELFEKARELKPSIIFIDEIDSIARARSANTNMGGGNDEREQTLNQILVEMDGFDSESGVVVIAATNRIDILDPAIKRAGRFDRQITISNPNFNERQAILAVHVANKKIDPSISLAQIAQRTVGFSGADLANLLNEAAILATRKKKSTITMEEISLTIDRLVLGLESNPLTRVKAKQLTAFHEMGHAFLGMLLNETEGIQKVTILPRGNAKGVTWTNSSSSQYSSRQWFVHQIFIALAGRAAEEMIGGSAECTVGSQQDIAQMTRTLRTMINRYAMTRLQELKQQAQQRNLFLLGSDVKQELNNIIDDFSTNFIDLTYSQVLSFLQLIRPSGERLVDELLIFEELSGKEIRTLVFETISTLSSSESLYTNRESSFFELVRPEIRQMIQDVDLETTNMLEEVKGVKKEFKVLKTAEILTKNIKILEKEFEDFEKS